MATADRYELGPDNVVAALEAALEGIQARGKAQRGEKTMVDAIGPGIDALQAARAENDDFLAALQASVDATRAGMEATIPMLATKGRASYLGERSIGHQDPGATSSYMIAQALLYVLEEGKG